MSMARIKGRLVPAVLAAAVGFTVIGFTPAALWAADPTTQPASGQEDLRAEVQELKSEVADLKSKDGDHLADEAKVIHDVLADADAQTNQNINAGYYNHRFFISSGFDPAKGETPADSNFLFQPWVHIQVRYSAATRQDFKSG